MGSFVLSSRGRTVHAANFSTASACCAAHATSGVFMANPRGVFAMRACRRLSCVAVFLFLTSAAARAHEGHSAEDFAKVASDMVATATNLLAALPDEQRAKMVYELKSDERLNWHFIPKTRNGLP